MEVRPQPWTEAKRFLWSMDAIKIHAINLNWCCAAFGLSLSCFRLLAAAGTPLLKFWKR